MNRNDLFFIGCKVVGFAGTDEKCRYLTEDLGFDHVFNYKKGTYSTYNQKMLHVFKDCSVKIQRISSFPLRS